MLVIQNNIDSSLGEGIMINQVRTYNYYTFQGFYRIKIDTEKGYSLQGTFLHISKILHSWIVNKFSDIRLPISPRTYINK